jgi:hypothetical protein
MVSTMPQNMSVIIDKRYHDRLATTEPSALMYVIQFSIQESRKSVSNSTRGFKNVSLLQDALALHDFRFWFSSYLSSLPILEFPRMLGIPKYSKKRESNIPKLLLYTCVACVQCVTCYVVSSSIRS